MSTTTTATTLSMMMLFRRFLRCFFFWDSTNAFAVFSIYDLLLFLLPQASAARKAGQKNIAQKKALAGILALSYAALVAGPWQCLARIVFLFGAFSQCFAQILLLRCHTRQKNDFYTGGITAKLALRHPL
jgi:hypothetical protein